MEFDAMLEMDAEFTTFNELLRTSLERNYSATEFFNLFQALQSKHEGAEEELNYVSLFTNIDKNSLQRSYVHELFVKSDIQNACHELINYFATIVKQISVKDQILILMLINQSKNSFSWKTYSENIAFLSTLAEYSQMLLSNFDQSTQQKRLIFLFVKLLSNFFIASAENKLNDKFIHAIAEFSDGLSSNSLAIEHKLLRSHLTEYNLTSMKHGFVTSDYTIFADPRQKTSRKLNESGNMRGFKVEKIMWLSQKVLIEFTSLDSQFTIDFKNLIKLSNVPTLESLSTLVVELMTTVFDCLQLSDVNSFHVWREYIVHKIPLFLKNELKINQIKLEKALSNVLHDDPKLLDLHKNIVEAMEKNLIDLELLRQGSLHLNSSTVDVDIQFTVDQLNHEYTNKFLECNPEFTSIEEIGIKEFLDKVNKSVILKHKFCQLVIESMNSFILTGDSLRLRRLIISMCMNFYILDNIMLFESPSKILLLLLKFLDIKISNTAESSGMNAAQKYLNQSNQPEIAMDYDMGSDDSSNVQEHLSDISTTCIFVQLIISRYRIIMRNGELDHFSQALSLLISSKLNITKTEDEQEIFEIKISDLTYNTWISSMFDSSNTEGISDSLVKTSTPFEYSILIPEIVSEAVLCNSIGWLDDDALSGGLEYFHEKFLAGWLVFAIQKIVYLKMTNQNENIAVVVEKVVKQLLTINETESVDIQVVVKICKTIMNNDLWNNFPSIRPELAEPAKTISFNDALLNIIKYVSVKDKKDIIKQPLVFDINIIWTTLQSQRLPVEFLYEKLLELSMDQTIDTELNKDTIAFLLVSFARWQLEDDIFASWSHAFHQFNESEENFSLLLFNRNPHPIKITGSVKTKSYENKDLSENPDSTFFGFLQDPDADNNKATAETGLETKNEGLDLYGYNLVVLAYQNKRNGTFDSFIRKLMDHLK